MMAMTTRNSMSVKPRRCDGADMTGSSGEPAGRSACTITAAGRALALFLALGCSSKPSYEGRNAAELGRMLHDADPAVQAQGALGLSRSADAARDSVPALIEVLKSPHALVRQNAALALGTAGPDAAPAVP